MVSLLHRRTVPVASILFTLAVVPACTPQPPDAPEVQATGRIVSPQDVQLLTRYDVQKCPQFRLNATPIQITPTGGTIDLGFGNSLIVPPGAVTVAGTYNVGYITEDGDRLAGVSIEGVGGAQTQFREPVELRLSYAGCPFEANTSRFVIIKRSGGGKPYVGGAKSANNKHVRTLLGGLTEFAIAI